MLCKSKMTVIDELFEAGVVDRMRFYRCAEHVLSLSSDCRLLRPGYRLWFENLPHRCQGEPRLHRPSGVVAGCPTRWIEFCLCSAWADLMTSTHQSPQYRRQLWKRDFAQVPPCQRRTAAHRPRSSETKVVLLRDDWDIHGIEEEEERPKNTSLRYPGGDGHRRWERVVERSLLSPALQERS